MAAIFNSPSKYIQGPDELAKLGSYVEPLGAKALVIVTPSGKKRVGAKIEGGFAEAKAELLFEDFNGECSKGEVDRLVALARDNGCDIIVGVGGGKILDTAKAVAYYLESPVIICPTIASTDAPCSALSVLYTDDGQFDKYLFLKANPNIVLGNTTTVASPSMSSSCTMPMGSPFLVTRLDTLETMPAHHSALPSGISWLMVPPVGFCTS